MGLCHRTLKKPLTKPLPSSVALFCSAYSPNALQSTITHQLSLLNAMDCRACTGGRFAHASQDRNWNAAAVLIGSKMYDT